MEQPVAQVCLVHIPCPDEAIAREIGRKLVQQGLAACANVIPKMTSIYRWEGKLEEERESLFLLKTLQGNLQQLQETVQRLHPYRLPGITAYPASGGLPEYLDWVARGSRPRRD